MMPETVARLSRIDNIVAIKEASGSLDQVSQILSQSDITVLSGDDSLTLPMMSLGAKGVISVAANIVPREVSDLVRLYLEGDTEGARKLHFKLMPIKRLNCRIHKIEKTIDSMWIVFSTMISPSIILHQKVKLLSIEASKLKSIVHIFWIRIRCLIYVVCDAQLGIRIDFGQAYVS